MAVSCSFYHNYSHELIFLAYPNSIGKLFLGNHLTSVQNHNSKFINPLSFLQQWLDRLKIEEETTARRIVKLIPAQCPFAREIEVFGKIILRIPPLCKLNPLYEQLIGLQFRALCFLAEHCGEDITPYCS